MAKKLNKKNKLFSESEIDKARKEIKQRITGDSDDTKAGQEKKIKVEVETEEPKPTQETRGWIEKTRDFASLYRGNGSKRVDMTRIEKKDPNRRKKIIGWAIFILVILLGITLAGFYFFVNQEDKFSGQKVDIEIDKPMLVASGDTVSFNITVNNQEAVNLVDAELTIQWPTDFVFNSSEPLAVNEANNAWSVGEIKKGSSKTVKVIGQLFGELDSLKDFTVILNYMPANFLSEFQKKQSFSITINDSIFDLDLAMPSKVISDYASTYKINFTNNSQEAIKRVQLKLFLPEDLAASDFSPSLDDEETIWEIDNMSSGASQTVTWQGVLSAEEGAMREIKAQIGYINQQGEYVIQVEKTSIIFLINPQLLLTLTMNESTQDNAASLGQTLDYIITYQNESQSEIKNMSVAIELKGELFDWDSLVDVNNGVVADQRITWDKSVLDSLSSVKPGQEGEIEFSITLDNSLVAEDREDINYTITSQATVLSEEVVDLEGNTLEVTSETITTKINSNLDLRAEGRYYNDEYLAVGFGPIPPEAGQTTQYQIYWYLQNGANEVSSVEVTTKIPEGIVWVNDSYVSAGNLSYDPAAHTVTWSINKMPEHVGQFMAELEARFAIEVTPQVSDIGKLLILLEKSQATASDTFTEQELSVTQDMITSDLTTDPQASGKGLVVKGSSSTNSNVNTSSNINSLKVQF